MRELIPVYRIENILARQ